ncbi:MAG: restriction endonuclease subunit S [Poseidonibacter sp.]|uniref:restriction endonuclease subunit S n=1 Tax=Poseidonibacter sp. TaxID=2321188 RepID=UPI00359EF0C4
MSELYELPDGWEWKKLGELCDFIRGPFGGSLKKQTFKESGNAVYEQSHAIYNQFEKIRYFIDDTKFEEMKRFELRPNSLIMSCSGTIGKVAIVPSIIKKGIINQALLMLTPNDNLNNIFLKLMIESNFFQTLLSENSTGAAIANVASVKVLKNLSIPLPPLIEQKRIVSKLDTLFEKIDKSIELHEKNIKEADAFMGSVLNEVFEELEDNNSIIKINDIVVKTNNKNTKENAKSNYTYIDISSIDNKLFKIEEPKIILGEEAPSRAKKEVFIGDILYATTRPNLKNIAIIEKEYDNPIASTGFCILRVNNENEKKFLFYYLLTNKLFEQIEPNIRGAQYPATSDKDLKNCNIPKVSLLIQQKVVKYLDKVSLKIEKTKAIQKEKLQNLKDLKASILDQAFKGLL